MEAQRWQRLQELFNGAFELPPEKRRHFLTSACDDDDTLLDRVAHMLEVAPGAEDRIAQVINGGACLAKELLAEEERADEGRPESQPRWIGPYRLLDEIGRGGMGTVYLGQRDDGEFRMRVAVKLVRRGLDTEDILRRLRQERHILASLDHPNIARLLDGGTTEDGCPYFVMEHIDGVPIDRYCDARRFSVRERLTLFRGVCSAVAYAHQNLIIHRDLKPSNVLVTREGVPKLLDFGIAKLLTTDEAQHTVAATSTGQLLLTPEYASPEQLDTRALTTATDIYSLSVMLYELLSGHRPYRLESRFLPHVAELLRDSKPEKPSTATLRPAAAPGEGSPEEIAHLRRSTPRKLSRTLAGDLDNIVLTGLRKEPRRRYASVHLLSEDLRRYLADLPVTARQETLRYRAVKFAARNRGWLIAAGLIFVALLAGMITTHLERLRAERNLEEAEIQRNLALEVSELLLEAIRTATWRDTSEEIAAVKSVLEEGVQRSQAERLRNDALSRAWMVDILAHSFKEFGFYQEARPLFEEVLALRRKALVGDHAKISESLNNLAALLIRLEMFDEATPLLRQAIAMQRRFLDAESNQRNVPRTRIRSLELDLVTFQSNLALSLTQLGSFAEAETLYQDILESKERLLGPRAPQSADTLSNLARLSLSLQDFATTERYLRQALSLRLAHQGESHPDTALIQHNLAFVLHRIGELDPSEDLLHRALKTRREFFGEKSLEVSSSLGILAVIRESRGRLAEAEPLYRQALTVQRELLGPSPRVAKTASRLARTLLAQKRYDEAERLCREALEIQRQHLPAEHPELAETSARLREILEQRGEVSGDPQDVSTVPP